MLQHLLRAACLAGLATSIWLMPYPAVVAVVGVPLLTYALLANRTRRTRVAGASVLVTGASSGLGRALAVEAAARGARTLLLVARNTERLAETQARIAAVAPACEAFCLECDMTDAAQVTALAAQVVADHGAPDILVNNAGAGAWQHIEESSAADIEAHMACPYFGAAWLTRGLVPAMAARGTGHVVNITSAASLAGFRAAVSYGTARWAMRGFSQHLRADLAPLGIGVTLLNGAEIAGTSYFDDAPGKAGADSHRRIPTLFQLPLVTRFNSDASVTASVCWRGVEAGTHEILHPPLLLVPAQIAIELFPDAFHHLIRLGPAGRRS